MAPSNRAKVLSGEWLSVRQLLAHTADLRGRVEAESLVELYEEGAALVREVLVGARPVERVEERWIDLGRDPDSAEGYFRFLRELVYLFDAENFLVASARPESWGVRAWGERFDPSKHEVEHQIKAVTRHGFRFDRADPPRARWMVEVIFDL